MASPTIRGYATATNGTDADPAFAVTMPSGVATGDLLIAFAANDTTGTAWTVSPGNGWTKLSDETYTTNHRLAIYALIADGTDGLTIGAADNEDYSVTVVAITTGTHGVTDVSTDIVIPAAASGGFGSADPPASGTVASKDWLAIAVAAVDFLVGSDSVSDYPSTYSAGVLTKSAATTSSVGLGVGHKALTAATSENPGAFTHTTTRPWIAKTILVPSAPPITGTSATTLQRVTAAGSGTTSTIGTSATTLVRHAAAGSGATVSPPLTGASATTLARHVAAGSGTAVGVVGTGALLLGRSTAAGVGVGPGTATITKARTATGAMERDVRPGERRSILDVRRIAQNKPDITVGVAEPPQAALGDFWFNLTVMRYWNGSTWVNL